MLINVDPFLPEHQKFLYELVLERYEQGHINVSGLNRLEPPSFKAHCWFLKTKEYLHNMIYVSDTKEFIGNVNITGNGEIGVFISKKFQNNGHGAKALRELMALSGVNPPFSARIHIDNVRSTNLFEKLGFRKIGYLYIKE